MKQIHIKYLEDYPNLKNITTTLYTSFEEIRDFETISNKELIQDMLYYKSCEGVIYIDKELIVIDNTSDDIFIIS